MNLHILVAMRPENRRYMQVGDETPDVSAESLRGAWEATQQLLRERKISAGHDISDGGLVTSVLEMAFAGNCGIQVQKCQSAPLS